MIQIFVDGANVAHENHETISAARIETAQNDLKKYGYESHALIPKYKINKMKDQEIVKNLVNEGRLTIIAIDDDEALIDRAIENDAFILTNDRFRDHKKKDWWLPEINDRLIPYDFINGHLSITVSKRHSLDRHLKNGEIMKPKNNNSNLSNANKGSSGTNKQYDQNQGNRGKQLNPNQKPRSKGGKQK